MSHRRVFSTFRSLISRSGAVIHSRVIGKGVSPKFIQGKKLSAAEETVVQTISTETAQSDLGNESDPQTNLQC